MKKILKILVLGLLLNGNVYAEDKQLKAEQSKWLIPITDQHTAWAKEHHSKWKNDEERYKNIVEKVLGKKIEFTPKKIPFPGINFRMSMNTKWKNGGMAEIKNASESAYSGNTFYSITVDQSKCSKNSDGFNDCAQDAGSSRVEFIPKKWIGEGNEKWINYSVLPAKNILWKPKTSNTSSEKSRRFTVGQCHPLKGQNITWMIEYKFGRLYLVHNFKSYKNDKGEWAKGTNKSTFSSLKRFEINEHHGSMDWTNIRINFKNSKKSDGKLKVWVDGKLKYDYEGPTNWKRYKGYRNFKTKCVFKFGLYTNANIIESKKELRENMTVFVDNMAYAKTEEKLEELLKKDE